MYINTAIAIRNNANMLFIFICNFCDTFYILSKKSIDLINKAKQAKPVRINKIAIIYLFFIKHY